MWVAGSVTLTASHHWACVPRVAAIVLVCNIIFVATHCLATVPGIAAVVIIPPQMELIIAFPGVVVSFSLFPESSDLGGAVVLIEAVDMARQLECYLGWKALEGNQVFWMVNMLHSLEDFYTVVLLFFFFFFFFLRALYLRGCLCI